MSGRVLPQGKTYEEVCARFRWSIPSAFNIAVDDRRPGAPRPNPAAEPGEAPSIGPVHVAYALRWLELGDGRRRGAFIDWLADPAERTLR